MFALLRQGYGGQAGRDGRAILAHLFRCEGLAVCLYSGALHASHLRQTCACKIQVLCSWRYGIIKHPDIDIRIRAVMALKINTRCIGKDADVLVRI